MGRFMCGAICACDPNKRFYRGHETCPDLPQSIRLSKTERRRKKSMMQSLLLDHSKTFTDLDFLLNIRSFSRVGQSLLAVRKALKKKYSERIIAEESNLQVDVIESDLYIDIRDNS